MEQTQLGRYVLVKEIGRGGQSRAYLARDPAIDRTVAIKQIRGVEDLPEERRGEFVQRFLQEARVVGTLSHPNIVSIYDIGEDDNGPYIVMEFVDGGGLEELIQEDRRMSKEDVIRLFLQICAGLDFAHKAGVVHRDIKPGNLLMTQTGSVKIVDFGVARMITTKLTQTGTLLGTPSYMSPEQIKGASVDHRSDIFSLGIVLYEALTGRLPFGGENPTTMIFRIVNDPHAPMAEIDPALAGEFGDIIDRCLAKETQDRFQDCREVAEALNGLLPEPVSLDALFGESLGGPASLGASPATAQDTDMTRTLVAPDLAETSVWQPQEGEATPAATAASPLGRYGRLIVPVAGLLLLGVVLLFLLRPTQPTPPQASMPPQPEPVGLSQTLLPQAARALAAGNLVGGTDSALSLALQARALGEVESAQTLIDEIQQRHRDEVLALAAMGESEAVVAAFERFLEFFPDDQEILDRKQVLQAQADPPEVRTPTQTASQRPQPPAPPAPARIAPVVPQRPNLERLLERGNSALTAGNLARATSVFREAVEVAPDNFTAAHQLGKALLATGQSGEAIRSMQQAARLNPVDPEVHVNLANAFESEGNLEEASLSLRKAILLVGQEEAPALETRLNDLSRKIRFQDLLPVQVSNARHAHGLRGLMGSCRGDLTVNEDTVRFQPSRGDHGFEHPLEELESLEVDGNTIIIVSPDGRTFNFGDASRESLKALSEIGPALQR